MRRAHIRTAALLAAAVLPLAACSGGGAAAPGGTSAGSPTSASAGGGTESPASPESPESPSATPSPTADPEEARVDAVLAGMSRKEQIAQLFLIGVPLDDIHRGDGLADRGVGGLFLAGRSTIAADDLARITTAWQETAGHAGLWIGVDQEGGNVQTLSGPGFADLPTAVEQGRLPADRLATLADDLGASLARAGVNLDLAPVVDVVPAGTEEQNGPIGVFGRQYGSTVAEVAAAARVVVDGLAEHGVTATLKHFPGLGRVRENTDTTARVVDRTTRPDDPQVRLFADLAETSDASPFVMTSSAIYPAMDDSRPAGFSPRVVDGLLRQELGFDGVVVSDDVGRAAAVQDVPPGQRAVRCLEAGGTLVLTVVPGQFAEMRDAVVEKDRTDAQFSAQVDRAVRTALLAKARAGLLGP